MVPDVPMAEATVPAIHLDSASHEVETANILLSQAGLRTDSDQSMANAVSKSSSKMEITSLEDDVTPGGSIKVTDAVAIASVPAEAETIIAVVTPVSVSAYTVSDDLSVEYSKYSSFCAIYIAPCMLYLRDIT